MGSLIDGPVSLISPRLTGRFDFLALTVTHNFGPCVGLEPMHPCGAKFKWATHAFFGPCPPADAILRLENHIVHASHL